MGERINFPRGLINETTKMAASYLEAVEKNPKKEFPRALAVATKLAQGMALTDTAFGVPESIRKIKKKNPHYRPFAEQVKEGILQFEKQGGVLVLPSSVERFSSQALLRTRITPKLLVDNKSITYQSAYEEGEEFNKWYKGLYDRKVTFKDLIIECLSVLHDGTQFDYQMFSFIQCFFEMLTKDKGEIIEGHADSLKSSTAEEQASFAHLAVEERIAYMEQHRKTHDRPMTFPELITWYLQLSKGDWVTAIDNLAVFLKKVTRTHTFQEQYEYNYDKGRHIAAAWVQTHILDTFNPLFSFNNIPEFPEQGHMAVDEEEEEEEFEIEDLWADDSIGEYDYDDEEDDNPEESPITGTRKPFVFERLVKKLTGNHYGHFDTRFHRVNLVGMPYRAASLLSMMPHFSPDLISLFVAGEYVSFGNDQGPVKLYVDLLILSELLKVDAQLSGS